MIKECKKIADCKRIKCDKYKTCQNITKITGRKTLLVPCTITCDCTPKQACKICAASKDIDWNIIEPRNSKKVS